MSSKPNLFVLIINLLPIVSETTDKISELIPKFIHPLSTTIRFLVFLTELIIGLVSSGRKDLKSIISVLTP